MGAPILVTGEATADELKAEIERLRGVERNAGRGRSLALAAHHALPGHDVDWRNVIELASALAPTEAK